MFKKKRYIIMMIIAFLLIGVTIFIVYFQNNSVEALSKYGSRGEEVKQIQTKLQQHIIQMIEQSGASLDNAINIDIKEFTDKNMRINWTPTTDIVKIKTQPIIIAPLTVDKFYQWLVIDGNHRITHAIAEREKSVKAFSLDPNALVEGNLFSTGFDKFLYIFQNEMIALASYIHRDGYSDEEAIKLAYFCSGKVQCYV